MRNVAQTAAIVAVLTLLSKCVGFVREIIMAYYYGAGMITDAYVMANAIPGILFGGIFAAVATAYMPLFSSTVELQGERAGNRFTSATINILLLASVVSAVVGILFSDQIVSVLAMDFVGEKAALTSFFVKVTFSFSLVTSVTGILNAYLQYKGVFISQVLAGYLQNVFLIGFIVISAYTDMRLMILGSAFGNVALLIIHAYLAKGRGYEYTRTLRSGGATRQIIALALPVFVGSTASQINAFVDKALASGLPDGSIASLGYAMTLIGFITGLTTSIFSMMIYPKLTRAFSQKDFKQFNHLMGTGIALLSIIAIPASLGAMAFSGQVVQVIYERGAFDPAATTLTTTAFFYYAVGLLPMSINTLLIQAYYAMHDTKTPVVLGFVSVGANVGFNLLLIRSMAHGGLALATSIAAFITMFLLYIMLRRKYPQVTIVESRTKLIKILAASLLAVGGAMVFYNTAIPAISHILYPRMLQLLLTVGVGAILYYICLHLLRVEETRMLWQLVKR